VSRATVVLVDDEERILRSLSLLLRSRYDVLATTDGAQVLAWVAQRPVHVVVSDQRMPQMSGVEVLRGVRSRSPRTMRVLLTGYADLAAVEASVNDGEIFRFLEKPWDATQLLATVEQAAQVALAEFAETAAPAPVPLRPAANAALRILVLDEDPASAPLVRASAPEPCDVVGATDVESALALLAEQPFAIVLAELRHSRDDAIGALKWLKREAPQTLAIACSGLRDGRLLIDLINQGQIFRFLPKPLSRELLRRALAAAADRHAELQRAPQRVQRMAVDVPRQEASLPTRLMDYFRRIREGGRLRA
jgi:DNA-binding NtrC family response regulator